MLRRAIRRDGAAARSNRGRGDRAHVPIVRAARLHRRDVETDRAQECDAGLGQNAGIAGQFDPTLLDKGISQSDAKSAGEVVVAGSGPAERGVARADGQPLAIGLEVGCDLHDAFHHARDRWRRQAMVAVTALLLDGEQADGGHPRQMAAGSLRSDAGSARQFGRGQRRPSISACSMLARAGSPDSAATSANSDWLAMSCLPVRSSSMPAILSDCISDASELPEAFARTVCHRVHFANKTRGS